MRAAARLGLDGLGKQGAFIVSLSSAQKSVPSLGVHPLGEYLKQF